MNRCWTPYEGIHLIKAKAKGKKKKELGEERVREIVGTTSGIALGTARLGSQRPFCRCQNYTYSTILVRSGRAAAETSQNSHPEDAEEENLEVKETSSVNLLTTNMP